MEKDQHEIRNMLFLDDERKKEITMDGEKYIVKALFPVDWKSVARQVSIEQNGLPSNSFSITERNLMEKMAIVDIAIVENPAWWKGSDKCPDEDYIDRLYGEIMKWTTEFQDRLKKNKLNKRGEEK